MAEDAAAPVATPKKAKATKAKKPKTAPTHPKVSAMITAAISTLKERKGSSVAAIKKYITATYKVDATKLAPFIKKYLKSAVDSGALVQTKGTGATGSFRIGGSVGAKKAKAPKKKAAAKKAKSPKKAKKAKAAPAEGGSVTVAKPKAKKAAKKPKAAKPKKPKAAKSPKKPKAAKPKKAKKAAPKRKAPAKAKKAKK